MINRIILTGRITNDVELRQTNDGIVYTYFTLAVNRQGNNREQTDFIPCVAWRAQAQLINDYLGKGSLIGAEGRIEVFTSQKDGQYNTRVTVNVSQIHFLEPRKNSESQQNNNNTFTNNNSNNISFEKESSNIGGSSNRNPNQTEDDVNFDDIDFENIKF